SFRPYPGHDPHRPQRHLRPFDRNRRRAMGKGDGRRRISLRERRMKSAMIFRRSISAALALSLALPLTLPAPLAAQSRHLLEYPSIHSPVVRTRGMVVSQIAIASEVGAQLLREGGSAVDAATAIGFALSVTLPRAGNIGGDGYMNVYDAASGEVRIIDFRSVAPRAATPAMFVDNEGKERRIASYGYMAPAVPGTVAGFDHAHRKWGK